MLEKVTSWQFDRATHARTSSAHQQNGEDKGKGEAVHLGPGGRQWCGALI